MKKAAVEARRGNNDKNNPDDFVAPDGGWGWVIVVACGLSNLCVLPMLQQFGLLFRDRFAQLGINASEITTLISVNCAIQSASGLANGPLFKKYSFREIALVNSLITGLSIALLALSTTFTEILISFSLLYGVASGFVLSANNIALNAYFKKKRRIATGLSWTCTGLGPIIMPQVITRVLPYFGASGTILLYAGVALNAMWCALLLQPVEWHISERKIMPSENGVNREEKESAEKSEFLTLTMVENEKSKNKEDSEENDDCIKNSINGDTEANAASDNKAVNGNAINKSVRDTFNNCLENSKTPFSKRSNSADDIYLMENGAKKISNIKIMRRSNLSLASSTAKSDVAHEKRTSTMQKIVEYFDLDLLRDPIYVNLMMGVTLVTFVEVTFALLTPFILGDYGFAHGEVATFMSVLGGVDVLTRLILPFFLNQVKLENKTLALIGFCLMGAGRFLVAGVRNYQLLLVTAVIIGFGKALRTIFIALVLPTHVPLSRLPAASGLQLLTNGIVYLLLGPVIGWLKDTTGSVVFTICALNFFTYLTAFSWIVQDCIYSSQKPKVEDH